MNMGSNIQLKKCLRTFENDRESFEQRFCLMCSKKIIDKQGYYDSTTKKTTISF